MAEGPIDKIPLGANAQSSLKDVRAEIKAIEREIAKVAKDGKAISPALANNLNKARELEDRLRRVGLRSDSVRGGFKLARDIASGDGLRELATARLGAAAAPLFVAARQVQSALEQVKRDSEIERRILAARRIGKITGAEQDLFSTVFDRSFAEERRVQLENIVSDATLGLGEAFGLTKKRGSAGQQAKQIIEDVRKTGTALASGLLKDEELSEAVKKVLGGKGLTGSSLRTFIATNIDLEQERLGRKLTEQEREEDFVKGVAKFFKDAPADALQDVLEAIVKRVEDNESRAAPGKKARKTQAELDRDAVENYRKGIEQKQKEYFAAARDKRYSSSYYGDIVTYLSE